MSSRFTLPPAQYAELVKRVLQRDGHKCRSCSSRGGLTAHHIQFRSDSGPDTSSNLVSLCRICHDAVHGKIATKFIVILSPHGEDVVPDADYSLKFRKHNKVGKRKTWRIQQ